MAMGKQNVQKLVLLGALLLSTVSYGQDYTYNVVCNHATPACKCPFEDNGRKVETCIFDFVIEVLQTFTRYNVDPDTNKYAVPHGGRVWYINETTGEYEPFPDGRDVCDITIPITDDRCTQPYAVDGYTFKDFIAINSRIPGPTLIVHHNQTVRVRVINMLLVDSISIHWHGLDQRGSNWMDGVESLTQCGVSPGTNFTYSFKATPPGTHWYHSHTGNQRNKGVYGGLIVLEEESTLDKVHDKLGQFTDTPDVHTLLLSEWQNEDPNDIFVLLSGDTRYYNTRDAPDPLTTPTPHNSLTVDGTEAGPIPFWSILINGRGRHQSIPYITSRLSIFTVGPSNTYRFRFIGGQHVFALRVSIDEHTMVVVATDGAFLEPVEVDYLILNVGERYDVLVQTKDLSDLKFNGNSNFLIRVETLEVLPPKNPYEILQLRNDHLAEAILHYDISDVPNSSQYSDIAKNSTPVNTTCVRGRPCVALNCPFKMFPPSYNIKCVFVHEQQSLLPPLSLDKLPSVEYEEQLFFNFGFEGSSGTSSINARSMVLPTSPLALLDDDKWQQVAEREFCRDLTDPKVCDTNSDKALASECVCAQVKQLSFNKSVQIVLSAVTPNPQQNSAYKSAHSVHIHGHHFYVVDVQFGAYNESNGRLLSPNTDISCGGSNQCTTPHWREGKGYQVNETGKIPALAPMKDTVVVPSGGYAVVYLQSDNPGYWYVHCGSEVHYLAGMGAIVAEGTDHLDVPSKLAKQCGNFTWSVDEYFGASINGRDTCSSDAVLHALASTIVGVVIIGAVITIVCLIFPRPVKRSRTLNTVKYKKLNEDNQDDINT